MFNTTTIDGPDTTDPKLIDWQTRQARAVVAFDLDAEGLPINPAEPDLPEGRNGLWHWGEAVAADAIVITIDPAGVRRVLMIEREDGHGWALPGGCLDPGETPEDAVSRELAEETGLDYPPQMFIMGAGRYVPDPRAGRSAWMVTVPGYCTRHVDALPEVDGRDDAARALWLSAGSYEELAATVADLGGQVFPAHVAMLREALA